MQENESLWSECSPEEKAEVKEWEKRMKRFKREVSKGYYTIYGQCQKRKQLRKELTLIEKKYEEIQLTLF